MMAYFGLIVLVVCVVFSVTGVMIFRATMIEEATQTVKTGMKQVDAKYRDWLDGLTRLTPFMTQDPAMAGMLVKTDAPGLRAWAKAVLSSGRMDVCTIIDTKGIVVARGHDDRVGDSLAGKKYVRDALSGVSSALIEEGTLVRFSLRCTAPIKNTQGDILGAVAWGRNLTGNSEFVDGVRQSMDMHCTLFYGDTRAATSILTTSNTRAVGTKMDNPDVVKTVLGEGKPFVRQNQILGKPYITAYWPIKNSENKNIGMFFIGREITVIEESVGTARNIFIVSGCIVLLFTILVVWMIAAGIARGVLRHADTMLQSANYVRASSEQLAQASQGLAAGSSEQAASIEEISASLEEISGMTKQNADNAAQADKLTHAVIGSIDNAHKAMQKSLTASQEIARASGETQKIIKTIDEIAFQTNLLSLNAAVEAARAGDAGAGFAVVADEVRSLSMRSAEASRRTAELIEETITRVNDGVSVFAESGRAIDEVVEQSGKVQQLVSEIAAASNEQSKGIEQINRGVVEMEKVVQQTAANSEETASSSEELSAQAEEMHATVDRLVEFIGGSGKKAAAGVTPALARPAPVGKKPVTARPEVQQPVKGNQPVRKNSVAPVTRTREITPEQIIPLDEEDMKDF